MSDVAVEDQVSLMSTMTATPSPETITKIVKRLRAMTLKLLPVEVEPASLSDPTSRIITPAVVKTYSLAAGDFQEALPYCLLRARQTFMWDANHDTADYGENVARATACEVLARRIVHSYDAERLTDVMSARFRYVDWDGDASSPTSALETAVDQHCTIFLSSSESQLVVNSLWRGDWVQQNNAHHDIDYIPYEKLRLSNTSTLDPSRLSVPRYQNWFRVFIWILFLFVYSQSVQQPTEQRTGRQHFDAWEIILYVMGLAYTLEDVHKVYKVIRLFTWKAFGFWNVISLMTDALLVAAFTLRVIGIAVKDEHRQAEAKLLSFQILSCVSPLIWMKVITVVDGFKYVGTLQICVSRMFQESTIFLALLSVLGVGFAQSLYALDASDGQTEHGYIVINQLIQALLQAPDFERSSSSPIGLTLYYLWSATVTVILLNILISLFSSAYADVTEDAEAEFMAFFAEKTVAMIRAPDDYVFPAPFNLIEIFFVVPFELFLTRKAYAQLSHAVMLVTFFPILGLIRLFEAHLDTTKNKYMRQFFSAGDDGEADDPAVQNPPPSDGDDGMQISRVSFDELVATFPNSNQSMEANIISEIHTLHKRIEELLAAKNGGPVWLKPEED